MVPERFKKMRVEGEFFDLVFNPFVGAASYSFSLGEGIRLEIKKFRSAVKLLDLLSKSDKKITVELIIDGFPKLEFGIGWNDRKFDFSSELKALDSAVRLLTKFDVVDHVDISFDEISTYGTQICQLEEILMSSPTLFKVEFGVEGEGYNSSKETACIFLVTTPIGSHIFGVILVITGNVEEIEGDRFRLLTSEVIVEQKIVSERDEPISNHDLVAAIETIEAKYDKNFSVVTMLDKSSSKQK